MNSDQWLDFVSEACSVEGIEVTDLRARLCEKASIQPQEDEVRKALRFAKGELSYDQAKLASKLENQILAALFSMAAQGHVFGSIDKVYGKYGERMDHVLKSGSREYRKLAGTFATFDTELEDIAQSDRSTVLYHILKSVEVSVRGLFFPTPGPHRVPVKERIAAMQLVLERYAPILNQESFYDDNPFLSQSFHGYYGRFDALLDRLIPGKGNAILRVAGQTLLMGLPGILVLLGDSLSWNLTSWAIWLAWMLWLVGREPGTSSRVGSFLLLVFAITGYEFNFGGWYGYFVVGPVAVFSLVGAYREKLESLGLEPVG